MSKTSEFDAAFKEFESAVKRTASIVRKLKKTALRKERLSLLEKLKQSDIDQRAARKKLESIY